MCHFKQRTVTKKEPGLCVFCVARGITAMAKTIKITKAEQMRNIFLTDRSRKTYFCYKQALNAAYQPIQPLYTILKS